MEGLHLYYSEWLASFYSRFRTLRDSSAVCLLLLLALHNQKIPLFLANKSAHFSSGCARPRFTETVFSDISQCTVSCRVG